MKKIIPFSHFITGYLFLFCYHTLYNNASLPGSTHNIFNLPVYCFICYLLLEGWKVFPSMNKNKWGFPLLGAFYGMSLVFGRNLYLYDAVPFTSLLTWGSVFSFSFVITASLLYFHQHLLPKLHYFFVVKNYPKLLLFFNKTGFFHFWAAIMICWLPVLLACYPGIASYDTNYQLSQVGETLNLTSHHPVIHTLLLGGAVQFGRVFFASANLGMFLYCCVQMLINSGIFAYCLTTLKKLRVSPLLCAASFAFFALMPFNSLLAICSTKDSIFSALFLLLILRLGKTVLEACPNSLFSRKDMVILILILFLLMIFRNNMVYAMVFSIPFMLMAFKKCRKQILCLCLIPIILLEIYQGLLYPVLNVTAGNSREAFSVIMQQYANVYHNAALSSEDRNLLLNIMDDTSWKKYEPRKSDAIKNHFKTKVFTDNLVDYLLLWVKLGVQFPAHYLNAFFNLTSAYWYPNDILPDETTYRKYIEIYDTADISFDSKIPWLFARLENLGMNASYQKYPVISIVFTPAFYLWMFLLLLVLAIYHKRYIIVKLSIIPLSLFLTLLLGPVALLRYLYPLVLCLPFFLAINTRNN